VASITNLAAGFWAAASAAIYLVFYTPMKKTSAWCTLVGAAGGALPPLIGWTAAGSPVNLQGASLAAILFVWQFPHLLALSWLYREDYARAGFKMAPVEDPSGAWTSRMILASSLALLASSLLPRALGMAGAPYLAGCALLGGALLWAALVLRAKKDTISARRFFLATVAYLPALFVLISFR
jgi:protoheme IX farnesyltransferase